jgi:hypothetical protein
VIGRLRPEATIAGMDARLTGLLRQWMLHEADYPSNWMAEIERTLAARSDALPLSRSRRHVSPGWTGRDRR